MKMDFGKTKSFKNFEDVSISDKIPFLYFIDVSILEIPCRQYH